MPRLRELYFTCRIVDKVGTVFSANRQKAVNVLDPTAIHFIHSSLLLHNSSSSPPKPDKEVPSIYLPNPTKFSICRRYPPRKEVKEKDQGKKLQVRYLLRAYSNLAKLLSARPPCAYCKKRGDTVQYSFSSNKQNGKHSSAANYLLLYLLPYPRGPTYLVSHSSRGVEQG